jgi:hypothetical protein
MLPLSTRARVCVGQLSVARRWWCVVSTQKRLLEDEALLSDHDIKDDAVLYMTLQIGTTVCVCGQLAASVPRWL